MTCLFCKGKMKDAVTTFVADIGSCIVIVKNVPCQKCVQCGEETYSDEVAKNIEKIVNGLRQSAAEIAVADYRTAA